MSDKGSDPSFEELYQRAPFGYLCTDEASVITDVNDTFTHWSGFSRDELVGSKRFYELLTAGGRIYHETHYAPLLRMQGAVKEIAVDFLSADGRKLPAIISAVAKREGEAIREIRIAVLDASDRREYEKELLRAKKRAETSEARARELARTLQESLIPPTPPRIPGIDIGAAFRPAGMGDEVGGDFYDVFELSDGRWAIVIGDVRGKGAPAAAVTALVRYTIRAAAMQTRTPSDVLQVLNDAMLHQLDDTFCTVLYALVDPVKDPGTVLLTSGGHPLPLLVASDGSVSTVGREGTLVGVLEHLDLHDDVVSLKRGESLVLFTDGVTEARAGRMFFGKARLLYQLSKTRALSASEIADSLVDELVDFQGGRPRDDIAVVVLRSGAP